MKCRSSCSQFRSIHILDYRIRNHVMYNWSIVFTFLSCQFALFYRECPEECREAVASLMYAAARFSDLPELRELRDIFQQRYGSCIEAFVNKKVTPLYNLWNGS